MKRTLHSLTAIAIVSVYNMGVSSLSAGIAPSGYLEEVDFIEGVNGLVTVTESLHGASLYYSESIRTRPNVVAIVDQSIAYHVDVLNPEIELRAIGISFDPIHLIGGASSVVSESLTVESLIAPIASPYGVSNLAGWNVEIHDNVGQMPNSDPFIMYAEKVGGDPLGESNDVERGSEDMLNIMFEVFGGSPSSDFIAFGQGRTVIDRSFHVPDVANSFSLLAVAGGFMAFVSGRRRLR